MVAEPKKIRIQLTAALAHATKDAGDDAVTDALIFLI